MKYRDRKIHHKIPQRNYWGKSHPELGKIYRANGPVIQQINGIKQQQQVGDDYIIKDLRMY